MELIIVEYLVNHEEVAAKRKGTNCESLAKALTYCTFNGGGPELLQGTLPNRVYSGFSTVVLGRVVAFVWR